MLKVDLIHSDVRPREICISAADHVSKLVRIYRSLYDFRVAHLVIPHILLSVCIVHLLYSKDNATSRQNLVEGLQGLEDLHECHYFGARSFRIIHTLAKKWNLPWPEEMQKSKLLSESYTDTSYSAISPPTDPLHVSPNTIASTANRAGPGMPYPPIGHLNRRESLSMFRPESLHVATHPTTVGPSGGASSQHLRSPASAQAPSRSSYGEGIPLPFQYSQPMSSGSSSVSTAITSPVTSAAEALFWTPMPGMPGPILPRNNYQQLSPMGLESVLRSSDMGERLGRDGFKINEDWRSSQVNGFNPGARGGVYGPSGGQSNNNYGHRDSFSLPSNNVGYQQSVQTEQQDFKEEFTSDWWQNADGNQGPMS